MNSVLSSFLNLTTKKIIIVYLIVGFLVYTNSLFNPFVGDDFHQIQYNPTVHSILNIPRQYTQGTFLDEDKTQGNNYYKPVLSSSFTLIYSLSKDNPFGYHLIQIIVHITNAIVLYFIFKYFFPKTLSFILSFLFLIHPFNAEAVIYISALQEPLFLLFGILAVYLNIRGKQKLFLGLLGTVLLSLSLLSKETGIVFLFVIPFFYFLFKKDYIYIGALQSILALLIYGLLRFVVAQIYFPQNPIVPIMKLSFWQRLINVPKIIFFYIKTFFYPKDLLIFQSWVVKSPNIQDFYIPIAIDIIFFLIIFIFGLIMYRKNEEHLKKILFFFVLFSLGLGLHLQIIPLDQTVADRWFYFPMVGMLGILGVFYKYMDLKRQTKLIYLIPTIFVIIAILSVRVVIRNTNWKSSIELITHDSKYNQDSYQIESSFGNYHTQQRNFLEAEKHFINAVRLFPGADTYSTLGVFYLSRAKFNEAAAAFEKSAEDDPNNSPLWYYLSISKYKAGDSDGAKKAAEKAFSISPDNKSIKALLKAVENNIPVIMK